MRALTDLLTLPVVTHLLQCNVSLYGNVARAVAEDVPDVVAYLGRSALVGWAERRMQDVVERALYPYLVGVVADVEAHADHTVRRYDVQIDDRHTTTLVLSYVSQFHFVQKSVGSITDFDVSLLQITRTGLGLRVVPPWLRMHPCPLEHVLVAVRGRQFQVVEEPADETHETWLLGRIRTFADRGWTHAGCRVRSCPDEPDEDGRCAICLEPGPRDLQLRTCGHRFHHRCFEEHCRTSMRRQPLYPRVVRCPLCRDPIKSYELAPVVHLE